MASNPDWREPNVNTSPSQIAQRVFEQADDLIRVSVVKGNISIDPGDIQIGAVEIKDGNTDTRATVVACDPNNNALLVKSCVDEVKTKINIFGSTTVAPGSTVTLASYTVAASKAFTFSGGIVGGAAQGEFHFEIAGSDVALYRNSGSNPSVQIRFLEPPTAGAATVINIKVRNLDNKTRSFEATLSGYTVDV